MGKQTLFSPKTDKLKSLYALQPQGVNQLKLLMPGKVGVFIDYANVRPWSDKLKWHVDPKRLKQFYDSFSCIK